MTNIQINLDRESEIEKHKSYLEISAKIFASPDVEVELLETKDIRGLAQFINEVLGEYNFYTAKNNAFVTLREAIEKRYMYMRYGRPRIMESDAVLEWVFTHRPELEEELDLNIVEEARQQYLNSDDIYPFFKIDTVDVNVYRRMTRGKNTPEAFLMKNINGLSKSKNGHLRGEEEITRQYLRNTYLSLLNIWNLGHTPVVKMVKK